MKRPNFIGMFNKAKNVLKEGWKRHGGTISKVLKTGAR